MRQMRLGVNAIRFSRPFTGVGRYMECLLKEWTEMDVPFETIALYTHSPLRQADVAFCLDRYDVRVVGRRMPDPLWEATALRAQSERVDLLFSPSYTLPLGWRGRCVVTNLGPPENVWWSWEWWRSQAYGALYLYSAHRADRVLACSGAVKRRLVDVYRVPEQKIDVTYLGPSERFVPIRDPVLLEQARRNAQIGPGRFVLFVGKMARRHYLPNLIEAFARLRQGALSEYRLVLVGPDYLPLDISGLARKAGVADRVVHVPYVVHSELPALYSAADFFVFPASEAEGFGIPVVEAMACGTPVITTDQGSLREVARGAALLTPTPGVEHLRVAMEQMATDAKLRAELVPLGIERARTFAWRTTAEKTMQVLWSVATSRCA